MSARCCRQPAEARLRHQDGGKALGTIADANPLDGQAAAGLVGGAQQGVDMPIGDQCRLVAHAEADHQSAALAREQLLHCGTARFLHDRGDPDPELQAAQGRRRGFGRFRDQLEGAANRRQVPGTCRGQLDRACLASEQLDAERVFQRPDMLAHCARRDAQLVGGAGEAHVAGGGLEGAQAAERRKAIAHEVASIARSLVCEHQFCWGSKLSRTGLSRADAAPIVARIPPWRSRGGGAVIRRRRGHGQRD